MFDGTYDVQTECDAKSTIHPVPRKPNKFQPTTLGQNVRAIREALGLSQEQVGVRAGHNRELVTKIESGKNPNPGLLTMEAIAKVLGVEVADLLLPLPGTHPLDSLLASFGESQYAKDMKPSPTPDELKRLRKRAILSLGDKPNNRALLKLLEAIREDESGSK